MADQPFIELNEISEYRDDNGVWQRKATGRSFKALAYGTGGLRIIASQPEVDLDAEQARTLRDWLDHHLLSTMRA